MSPSVWLLYVSIQNGDRAYVGLRWEEGRVVYDSSLNVDDASRLFFERLIAQHIQPMLDAAGEARQ